MEEFETNIGQLFIIGLAEEQPSETFLSFLEEKNIGGVLLFEESCRTHEQAAENIRLIKSRYRETPPFIAIDQEGGRVCRLKKAPAEYRAASDYGRHDELEKFVEDYTRSAVFMESIGINLNFAPVCDLWINPKNSCLEERCFGSTPEVVSPYIEQAVQVARKAGLLSCLKHFPGLGAAGDDPHKLTATADYDEQVWTQREMLPFAAGIEAGAEMVMTTHISLPRLDNENLTTASSKIVFSLLKERLDFNGLVITDDLLMEGIASLGSVGERAVKAFIAGHDILLFGRDFDAVQEAYEFFAAAANNGEIPAERLKHSLEHIYGMKIKLDCSILR